jgi:NAD(P)-dependent dehydrogenase (short-subunit alcohol dehydrogenase family)
MRGKSALITGSVDGIGFAIAEALARIGCSIMLNGFADPDLVEQRRATLSGLDVKADHHGADLSVPALKGRHDRPRQEPGSDDGQVRRHRQCSQPGRYGA